MNNRLISAVLLTSLCAIAHAQQPIPGPAVTKAYPDTAGRLHILTANGHDYTIFPRHWQAGGGFSAPQVAPDGRTVGWLVNQMLTPLQGATSYSYPVALELDIWRDGRVIRRFPAPDLTIENWIFLKNGSEAAFHLAPPHGQEFYQCDLFDVATGKRLAHWSLDRKNYIAPDWVKALLVDDPLPGPNEISNWFPDDPTPKVSSQPHQQ